MTAKVRPTFKACRRPMSQYHLGKVKRRQAAAVFKFVDTRTLEKDSDRIDVTLAKGQTTGRPARVS